MFGISGVELLLILVFAFLILGPDKLPEMAKTAGKAIARFRDAQKDMNEVLKENDLVDEKTGQAISNPVDMVERVAKVAADGKGEQMVRSVTSAAAAAATSVIKPDKGEEPAGGAAPSEDSVPATKDDEAPLSFAERKARYERERAAREAAAAAGDAAETVVETRIADENDDSSAAEALSERPTSSEPETSSVHEAAVAEDGDA